MYKFLVLFLAATSCALAAKSTASATAKSTATSTPPPKNNDVIRPCHPVTEKCVRDNLAANSKCRPLARRSVPKSYVVKEFRFEAPFFNSSYIDRNLVIQNQDKCRVSEFFYNVKKDVAVLSLDCPGLVLSSNRTLIQHASYKEDSYYSFTSTWEYPLIRLTANINNADVMDICNLFVFADVAVMPRFVLTPNDKPTKNFLSYDLSLLNIYEREAFGQRAPELFRKYINTAICDFGCKK